MLTSLKHQYRASSPRRLTADASLLLVLSSGPPIVLAALNWGSQFGNVKWPPSAFHTYTYVQQAVTLVQLLWLAKLLIRTFSVPEFDTNRRITCVGVFAVLSTLVVMLPGTEISAPIKPLIRSALLAWLAYEVCRRHRIPLSIRSSDHDRISHWDDAWTQTTSVVLYCWYGGSATFVAVQALRWLGPSWIPVMHTDQATTLGIASSIQLLLALPATVVLEGVVIGIVGILLHTAHRPVWQIYTIIAVPEVIFHAYFGVPAVLMALYAILCVRLYMTHHRLGPLLLGHTIYDLLSFLLVKQPFIYRIPYIAVVVLTWAGVERWFTKQVSRSNTGL